MYMGSSGGSVVKNPLANAGDAGDADSVSGSRRSPWVGSYNPLQYFCLKNSIAKKASLATVCEVTKSWTWIVTEHTYMYIYTHMYICILCFFSFIYVCVCKYINIWHFLFICSLMNTYYHLIHTDHTHTHTHASKCTRILFTHQKGNSCYL